MAFTLKNVFGAEKIAISVLRGAVSVPKSDPMKLFVDMGGNSTQANPMFSNESDRNVWKRNEQKPSFSMVPFLSL